MIKTKPRPPVSLLSSDTLATVTGGQKDVTCCGRQGERLAGDTAATARKPRPIVPDWNQLATDSLVDGASEGHSTPPIA